jgi:hypothetical protein
MMAIRAMAYLVIMRGLRLAFVVFAAQSNRAATSGVTSQCGVRRQRRRRRIVTLDWSFSNGRDWGSKGNHDDFVFPTHAQCAASAPGSSTEERVTEAS